MWPAQAPQGGAPLQANTPQSILGRSGIQVFRGHRPLQSAGQQAVLPQPVAPPPAAAEGPFDHVEHTPLEKLAHLLHAHSGPGIPLLATPLSHEFHQCPRRSDYLQFGAIPEEAEGHLQAQEEGGPWKEESERTQFRPLDE